MTLPDIRRLIDAIDVQLLTLLAERLALARKARSFKTQIEDSGREEELRRNWRKIGTELGLESAVIDKILADIISASRSVQSS